MSVFNLTHSFTCKGNFVSVRLEMAAAARAQAAGGQEFADFSTELGVGTYIGQVMRRRKRKKR